MNKTAPTRDRSVVDQQVDVIGGVPCLNILAELLYLQLIGHITNEPSCVYLLRVLRLAKFNRVIQV